MFTVLLSLCTSTEDHGMGCTVSESQAAYPKTGSITFTCSAPGADATVKAKLGPFVDDAAQYKITGTDWGAETTSYQISYENVEQVITSITIAVVPESGSITKYSEVAVNILPKPTLSSVVRTGETSPINVGTELTFHATISNTVMPEAPKIKYEIYAADEDKNGFSSEQPSEAELSAVDGHDNTYSFKFAIPEGTAAKDYKLIAKFVDSAQQDSDFAKTEATFTVSGPSIECTAVEGKNFAVDGAVKAKCTITGTEDKTLAAKPGPRETSTQAGDYSHDCTVEEESHVATCTFTGNVLEANKVSIAVLTSGKDTIVASQDLDFNLIAATQIDALSFVGSDPYKIYREDVLEMKVTVSKPGMTEVTAKVDFVAQDAEKVLTAAAQSVTLTKIGTDGNDYKFQFKVPAAAEIATHKLLFQGTNLLNVNSEILEKEIVVSEKPTLVCKVVGNSNFKAEGNVELTCEISESIKTKTFKYRLTGEEYKETTHDGKKITFTYAKQDSAVNPIYIAAFEDDNKIIESSVDATIFPEPSITSIEDIAGEEMKYIVGNEIKIKITTDKFHKLEDAQIKYGFIENDADEVKNEATAKPELIKDKENEYTIAIKVPESEKVVASKILKMSFTDKAGQSTTAKTSKKINFKQTIFMAAPKIGTTTSSTSTSGSDTKPDDIKFKKTDTIKFEITLSNLLEDWRENTHFGYVFGDKDGNLSIIDHFDVVEATKTRRLSEDSKTVSLNITVPESFVIPEDGTTTLFVYTLDKENNKVSAPIEQEIVFETKPSNENPDDDGKGKLSGGPIAGIVIAVIAVVAGAAAGVFFYMKKKGIKFSSSKVSPAEKP